MGCLLTGVVESLEGGCLLALFQDEPPQARPLVVLGKGQLVCLGGLRVVSQRLDPLLLGESEGKDSC